jgi:hypothetical protein
MHPAAVKVLATLNPEWDGLGRHRDYPELPLDYNGAERALRGPVVGRKNFYGSGSKASAELASRVWAITATAGGASLNPLAYLGAYLNECAQVCGTPPTGAALDRFLPWPSTPSTEPTRPAGPTRPSPTPPPATPPAPTRPSPHGSPDRPPLHPLPAVDLHRRQITAADRHSEHLRA